MSLRPLAGALLAELMSLPDDDLRPLAERLAPLVDRVPPTPARLSPYLTVPEAAALLRCAPKRLYNMRSDGRLSQVQEGRRALLLRDEVERLASAEHAREARGM